MILELRNICKTYIQGKLDVPVLKNVSLSVAEGEYLAIMGPSGSGKTTLMNIIGCLDNPTSGEYLLEGEDLSGQNDAKLSQVRLRSIGFVFQSFYLLSRQSAVENVALPLLYAGVRRRERLETARKALERVGLGDRTEFKPTQLSGGQCQRVAIARAIVNNPKILLADEPTGALDTKSGEQIMEIFQKLNQEGVTIVMITHEPEIAAHAQRTLHIRDGRLVDAQGNFLSPEETQQESGTSPEETLPSDVIPAREFLSEPLSARETVPKAAVPIDVEHLFEQELEEAESSRDLDEAEPIASDEAAEPSPEPAPIEEKDLPADEPVETREDETVLPAEEEKAAFEEEPASQEHTAEALDIEKIEIEPDYSAETFLDAEIAALLDQSPAFDTGDAFLAEAGIKPEETPKALEQAPEKQPSEEPEPPVLVARPTKNGAPEQISFDIWADPEEPVSENASGEDENSWEQVSLEAAPAGSESGKDIADDAAEGISKEEPYEADSAEEDAPFDTAFDAIDPYTPETEKPSQGQFGTPMKTEIDLSNAFGRSRQAPNAAEAPEPSAENGYRKLVEIDNLGLNGGDSSAHREDNQ